MNKIYINGRIVSEEKAAITVFDRSYLYGEGVFETMRAYSGRPAFCDMHYHRLKGNCSRLKIDLPLDEYAFERAVHRTINANKLKEAYVRATVSSVGFAMGLARPKARATNIVIFAKRLIPRPPVQYQKGIKIIIVKDVFADDPDVAAVKSTNYLTRMIARDEVTRAKAEEGLICNRSGMVLEGSATNLFAVKDGVLYTPPLSDGCLPGVTRWVVIGLAEDMDIPLVETSIRIADIKKMDEIFLTGSTSEILPVAEVAGISKRKAPGPTTARLMKAYKEIVG